MKTSKDRLIRETDQISSKTENLFFDRMNKMQNANNYKGKKNGTMKYLEYIEEFFQDNTVKPRINKSMDKS